MYGARGQEKYNLGTKLCYDLRIFKDHMFLMLFDISCKISQIDTTASFMFGTSCYIITSCQAILSRQNDFPM